MHAKNIDIGGKTAGEKGDAIVASMSGIVTFAGVPDPEVSPSQSTYIIIKGDDGRTYNYVHEDIGIVIPGTRVRQGQLLGFMSSNGSPGNVHLHFEIRENGKVVDPLLLLPKE